MIHCDFCGVEEEGSIVCEWCQQEFCDQYCFAQHDCPECQSEGKP